MKLTVVVTLAFASALTLSSSAMAASALDVRVEPSSPKMGEPFKVKAQGTRASGDLRSLQVKILRRDRGPCPNWSRGPGAIGQYAVISAFLSSSDPLGFYRERDTTLRDPGGYQLCGWLAQSSSSTTAAALGTWSFDVQTPRPSLTLSIYPGSPRVREPFRVKATGNRDGYAVRYLRVKMLPANRTCPDWPSGPGASNQPSVISSYFSSSAGLQFVKEGARTPSAAGSYKLCGWLLANSGDKTALGRAEMPFSVRAARPR